MKLLFFFPLNLAVFCDGDPHGDDLCIYELCSKSKYIPYFFVRGRCSKGCKGNAESDQSRVWVSSPVKAGKYQVYHVGLL